MTNRITSIIVGGGQAGLAMSRELTRRGVDHILLERGHIGQSWRDRRWENLRLQTPNWANALPGDAYGGPNPDGYFPARQMVGRLETYAELIAAPVVDSCRVEGVRFSGDGFELATTGGLYRCQSVIAATGACATANVPLLAAVVPNRIHQVTAASYRRPDLLPDGGVLVVGASASGVQIAAEVQASGRPVTLAAGSHLRLPRRYRGRDIEWWLEAIGALDERFDEVDNLDRVRATPSPQITGGPHAVDLTGLQAAGVEIVGRLSDMRDGEALFSGGLANVCAAADLKMIRLLDRIETWIQHRAPAAGFAAPEPLTPTPVPAAPRVSINLNSGEIRTVIWATGYRPDFSWLDLPIFDHRGRLVHHGGVVTGVPGLYALGLPFLRRRRSPQISGAGPDAFDIAEKLMRQLGRQEAA